MVEYLNGKPPIYKGRQKRRKKKLKLQNSHREDNTIASGSVYISVFALNANRILFQHSQ